MLQCRESQKLATMFDSVIARHELGGVPRTLRGAAPTRPTQAPDPHRTTRVGVCPPNCRGATPTGHPQAADPQRYEKRKDWGLTP